MAMSLGKRSWSTNACTIVDRRRADTASVETAENMTARTWVTPFVTSFEYLMVAMAMPVIGKVYAHHDNENLYIQEIIKFRRPQKRNGKRKKNNFKWH